MTRPHVSDHAMLRYLERVVGINVEAHRQEVERAVTLGASALISDGYRYVLSDFRVTTVAPASSAPRNPPRWRSEGCDDGLD